VSDLVLIDTSAWIRFFRTGEENRRATDEVERLMESDRACYTEPVYVELAIGARSQDELRDGFVALHLLNAGESEWRWAWETAFKLREKGLYAGATDLVIAGAAVSRGVRVFHHDKHFRWIAEVSALEEYSYQA